MTVEQHMQRGDFEAALALLATQITGAAPDPGLVLMASNLEVRLQRFDAAERTIRRLLPLAPQLAGPLGELAGNARAEARMVARRTDPAIAGKRAGIGMPPPRSRQVVLGRKAPRCACFTSIGLRATVDAFPHGTT